MGDGQPDKPAWDWFVIAVGLLLPAALAAYHELRRRGTLFPPQRRRSIPWNVSHVLLVYFVCVQGIPVLCFLLFNQLGLMQHIYGTPTDPDTQRARQILWVTALALPLQVSGLLALLRQTSDALPWQLGWTTQRLGQNLVLGYIFWVVAMLPILLVNGLVERLLRSLLDAKSEPHPIQKLLQGSPTTADWIMAIITAVVAAAVMEELFYRGVLQGWLTGSRYRSDLVIAFSWVIAVLYRGKGIQEALVPWLQGPPAKWRWSILLGVDFQPALFVLLLVPIYLAVRRLARTPVGPGIFASALLFAIMHASVWPSPVALLLLGLLLGFLAYRTQSLVGPMVFHALVNTVAIVALLRGATEHPV